MKIRKHVKGADSFGNFWEHDNAVLEIDAEQAAHLLAIPDGGYSIVEDGGYEPPHRDAGIGLPDGPDTEGGRRMATRVARDTGPGEGPRGKPVRDVDVTENLRPGGEGKDQGMGPLAGRATVSAGSTDGTPGVLRTPDPEYPVDPAQNSANILPARADGETDDRERDDDRTSRGRSRKDRK